MQGVKLEQMKGPEFEPSDQEIEDYGQKVKEQNAQRNKEIIESWK